MSMVMSGLNRTTRILIVFLLLLTPATLTSQAGYEHLVENPLFPRVQTASESEIEIISSELLGWWSAETPEQVKVMTG